MTICCLPSRKLSLLPQSFCRSGSVGLIESSTKSIWATMRRAVYLASLFALFESCTKLMSHRFNTYSKASPVICALQFTAVAMASRYRRRSPFKLRAQFLCCMTLLGSTLLLLRLAMASLSMTAKSRISPCILTRFTRRAFVMLLPWTFCLRAHLVSLQAQF